MHRSANDEVRNAAVPAAVAGASRPRFGTVTIRHRGHLPHWEVDAGLYFLTFRLADSLPQSALAQFRFERENIIATARQLGRQLSASEEKRLALLFSRKIERQLDAGAGACVSRNPRAAALVARALQFFDGKRYRLLAWCVMPNHVHVLAKLFPGQALAKVVHSWKSYTAKQVNAMLGRSGKLWAREYYDHLVRQEEELGRIVRYIAHNPVKAGLRAWKWVWVRGQDARATAAGTAALP